MDQFAAGRALDPALGARHRATAAAWEPAIRRFEAFDRLKPPKTGGIVFAGSSTFTLWPGLAASFPNRNVINRAFGGSQLFDSLHFVDRIITKHQPKVVVLYAGDNDLESGVSPAQVAGDFRALVAAIRKKLPRTKVVFVSVKPSPSRAQLIPAQKETNRLVRQIVDGDRAHLSYVDVFQPMLDSAGRPREELFGPDMLHMNAQGYALWRTALRHHLDKIGAS